MLTVKPQTDVLGRNKGKQLYLGTTKIAEESIVYRKVGDHATNMPASIYFGDYNTGDFALKDNLKYAYDKMGNILSIKSNGELVARYTYDKLNRLVREDNKIFEQTYLYNYDTNGNLLNRRETDFTLRTTDLEEYSFISKEYAYNGDKLVSYNGEAFAYDTMFYIKTFYTNVKYVHTKI